MLEYIWLAPVLPLVGFLINGLVGYRLKEKHIGIIASTAIGLSFLISSVVFFDLLKLPETERVFTKSIYTWITAGSMQVKISFLVDPLTMVMLLVVTGVGLLIHVYSIGYMSGDQGFARYFAFLNLFTFSMLLLVLADNFLLMFVGWEGVGLCSYFLIGFWFEEDANAAAGRKAFVVNRIGDFGFLIGLFLIFLHFGSFNFETVFSQAALNIDQKTATAIALLLFVGAVGKSAQIPLYVWLPDAMAGPTPVSALIHAATMVTAGVYMVARSHVIFMFSTTALSVVALIGVATALLAATIALVNNDIKRVLAYSTISQLGYMFLACGVGAFSAGIFHLSTHAYFKALLFLSAGSVMHALANETDMTRMGGLKSRLPVTFKLFLVGALALAGVPFLSGFFSKDEILWRTLSSPVGGFSFWLAGAVVAGLTAFYIFRLFYLTFYGKLRASEKIALQIHESPRVMTVPMYILAGLSVVGGLVGIPHVFNRFDHFLQPVFSRYVAQNVTELKPALLNFELSLMGISTVIVLMGIGFAFQLYVQKTNLPEEIADKFKGLYHFLRKKWYVDEIYDILIVRPFNFLSEVILWRWFDVLLIDGLVNKLAIIIGKSSNIVRKLQTGLVQNYALSILVGVVLLISYFLFK